MTWPASPDESSLLGGSHHGRDVTVRILNLEVLVCGPTNVSYYTHNI